MGLRLLTIVLILWLPGLAYAQEGVAGAGQPLDRLENALGELDDPPEVASSRTRKELLTEVADLQETLRQLQDILDEKVLAIKQLENENEKLRQALRLRFGQSGQGLPPVPMPNRDLIESVIEEPDPVPERQETMSASAAGREAYTVVSEWGRSPEVAASLPGDVSSLVGMAIAVPPETPENTLIELGKELRQNYAAYDNVNIEIFNDLAAARRYANEGKTEAAHRVMTVAKFKHSERDTIILYRNGQPMEIQ